MENLRLPLQTGTATLPNATTNNFLSAPGTGPGKVEYYGNTNYNMVSNITYQDVIISCTGTVNGPSVGGTTSVKRLR